VGGNLTIPVVAEAQALDLFAEVLDILFGGRPWMGAGLDGIVLRRQAERIEAHRMEDVVSVHPEESAVDIGGGISFRMADMESSPGRIREHIQDIHPLVLGDAWILGDGKTLMLVPVPLPFRLYFMEGIFAHGSHHTFASRFSQRYRRVPSSMVGENSTASILFPFMEMMRKVPKGDWTTSPSWGMSPVNSNT